MKSNQLSLRFVYAIVFLLSVVSFAAAQEDRKSWKLSVRAERESALYAKGEPMAFQVRLTQDGKPVAGKQFSYRIEGDGRFKKEGTLASAESAALIEATLNRPGFLKCVVTWNDAPGGPMKAIGGAGFDPLEIRTGIPEPADFDAFWNAKKEALATLPLEVQAVPVPAEKVNNADVEVFDIKVNCLGGKPVSGYLAKPKDAKTKSLPILISYHGAGVRSAQMQPGRAAQGALALDINAHGIENGQPDQFYKDLADGELKEYRMAHGAAPDDIYFVGMYLRVIRSIQYMKSLPEWDGKTLAVMGGSQGGGQALVAAGTDHDVTFCIAYVPALCYPTGSLEGCFDGWPGFLRGRTMETADPVLVKTVPYVDAALFAKRIKAPAVLSTGFVDEVCSPTSVYVAYNNIQSSKTMLPTPETGHGVPPQTTATANKLLWEHLKGTSDPKK